MFGPFRQLARFYLFSILCWVLDVKANKLYNDDDDDDDDDETL